VTNASLEPARAPETERGEIGSADEGVRALLPVIAWWGKKEIDRQRPEDGSAGVAGDREAAGTRRIVRQVRAVFGPGNDTAATPAAAQAGQRLGSASGRSEIEVAGAGPAGVLTPGDAEIGGATEALPEEDSSGTRSIVSRAERRASIRRSRVTG
jgi:hypothetical protein